MVEKYCLYVHIIAPIYMIYMPNIYKFFNDKILIRRLLQGAIQRHPLNHLEAIKLTKVSSTAEGVRP